MLQIGRCLNIQLKAISNKAKVLNELNGLLRTYLPSSLKEHCKVGSFEKGSLIITTTSSAWATELHYLIPELRDRLRKDGGLYQLISIKMKIVEKESLQAPKKKTRILSPIALNSLKEIISQCNYPPLKDALSHLADLPRNKDNNRD